MNPLHTVLLCMSVDFPKKRKLESSNISKRCYDLKKLEKYKPGFTGKLRQSE